MIEIPIALHIPDGFLSAGVAAACGLLAIGAVAYGLRVANVELDEARVPLLGVLAAFIFAAQMLNFPIAGGTSGHFLGATLAAVLLGPWLACLVMAVVLVVQAFAFADGGISALGANVLNMGVLGALLAGFLVAAAMKALPPHARGLPRRGRRGLLAGRDGGRRRHQPRAGDVRHRPARHLAPGDARRAHADRHRRGGDHASAAVSAVLAARPDLVALAPEELTVGRHAGGAAGGRGDLRCRPLGSS